MIADKDRIVCVGSTLSTNLPTENPPPTAEGGSYVLVLDATTGEQIQFRYMYQCDMTGVAISGDGEILVSGIAFGEYPLPVSSDAADTTLAGDYEGFVARYGTDLSLKWLTYLGGSHTESAPTIQCHEPTNSIVVALGTLSEDMLVHGAGWPSAYHGGGDLYLCALSEDGRTILWGGYFGGSEWDYGNITIAFDDAENLIMSVTSQSLDLPISADALGTFPTDEWRHGYIASMAMDTRVLNSATYLPSNAIHEVLDFDLLDGSVVVVGKARTDYSTDYFTPTADAYDTTIEGFTEAFMLRFTNEVVVGLEQPSFETTVQLPRLIITWEATAAEHYEASVVRDAVSHLLPVTGDGSTQFCEDI